MLALVPMLQRSDLPSLPDAGALARLLDVDDAALRWLADCRGHERRRRPTGRHYVYRCEVKASGGLRLIEAPKPRLKRAQRELLRTLLERVPTHEAAHGFVRDRSVRTNAMAHSGTAMVLRIDLRDFFASVAASRVHATFSHLGYPHDVARLLTGLCTNATPGDVWPAASPSSSSLQLHQRWHRARRYAQPHLPAGAPTSPALANLAAFRLDRRLAALAATMECRYTRYADDLTFSGGDSLRRGARACFSTVCEIATEEGFRVHPGKTRFQPRARRQRVTGLVVNDHPNVTRETYDRLRATLFNCVRFGPRSQTERPLPDFEAHLRGLVEWCSTTPHREEKLRGLFGQITWA